MLTIVSRSQLYRFLARRTGAKFNRIILRRLFMSKIHRPPMSLARIIRFMNKPEREGRIVVVVGTVTNDVRIFKVPKMTVSDERGYRDGNGRGKVGISQPVTGSIS